MTARELALERTAKEVLAAADQDVGIARLSADELSWVCPKCGAVEPCGKRCTRGRLLQSLDELEAALAQPSPLAEAAERAIHEWPAHRDKKALRFRIYGDGKLEYMRPSGDWHYTTASPNLTLEIVRLVAALKAAGWEGEDPP